MNCLSLVNTWVLPRFYGDSCCFIYLVFCVVFFILFVFVVCLMSKVVCVSGLLLFCVLCPKSSLSLDCSFGFLLRLFKQKYMLKGSDNKQIRESEFYLGTQLSSLSISRYRRKYEMYAKVHLTKLLTGKHRIQTCTIVSPSSPFIITFTNSFVKYKDNC